MKVWYQSKTLWVNFAGLVTLLAQWTSGANLIPPELLATILAVANFVLRFLTDQPISIPALILKLTHFALPPEGKD